jgi:ubiquinone/menaquinone biosynthesis C-methylase UbiE
MTTPPDQDPERDLKQEVRAHWARIAPCWHAVRASGHGDGGEATRRLLEAAQLEPGLRVLDLACGAGDPALELAPAVAPGGRVVATDLVPEMLAPLRERLRIDPVPGLECGLADAEDLPFEDGGFDRVTCAFGAMFFPDIERALAECHRVLAPGGRLAFAILGPREQFRGIHTILETLSAYVSIPPASTTEPNMFRFGDPGELLASLGRAGFQDIQATPVPIREDWQGDAESYLEKRATDFDRHTRTLSESQRGRARSEVLTALAGFAKPGDDGEVALSFPVTVTIISARQGAP